MHAANIVLTWIKAVRLEIGRRLFGNLFNIISAINLTAQTVKIILHEVSKWVNHLRNIIEKKENQWIIRQTY